MTHPPYKARPRANQAALDELVGHSWPYLDQGRVMLLDAMGDDLAVTEAARLSYGDARPISDDETLLRYLMRHDHSGPFEMCEIKLEVCLPIYVDRQFVRHRTASRNEQSGRYTEMSDACHTTRPSEWRAQSSYNKQGSGGPLADDWPKEWVRDSDFIVTADGVSWEDDAFVNLPSGCMADATQSPAEYLTWQEQQVLSSSRRAYRARLDLGVAREQARKDLPLSTYTRMVWKIDLRNAFHFLDLRLRPDAQQEIRDLAKIIDQVIAKLFPMSRQAFEDYVLDSMRLSGPTINLIASLTRYLPPIALSNALDEMFPNKRERAEVLAQLNRLKLAPPA